MTKKLDAVYENGVLRPLEPLPLDERQRVTITISDSATEDAWLDAEYLESLGSHADQDPSLEAVRKALSRIPGSLTADFAAEREER